MKVGGEYFGRMDYLESLKIQDSWVQRVKEDPEVIHVLGFEYDPVITLGIRGSEGEDLIDAKDIPVVSVPRGGQVTLHSPGQIVIYPICNIMFHNKALKSWTADILGNSQAALKTLGFEVVCSNIGLYQGDAKVASLGLKIAHRISTFGIAINLKNDPQLFQSIRPCGIANQSISSLGFNGELGDFFKEWLKAFSKRLIH